MTPLIIVDVPNLCWRAFYALAVRGDASGPKDVVRSFLQTLNNLQARFGTERFAFCFDHIVSYRREIFPDYKRKRKEKAIAEQEKRKALVRQIKGLRKKYLPGMGFTNIFRVRGMESDDLMAALARSRRDTEELIILVTSDSDLLQCLRRNVSIYSPHTKRIITKESFMQAYGIKPVGWAYVKAIAGCATDGIPGILGVGETGALKYLRGQLKENSPQFHWITCEKGQHLMKECLRLVKLPLEGCPTPVYKEDRRIYWRASYV